MFVYLLFALLHLDFCDALAVSYVFRQYSNTTSHEAHSNPIDSSDEAFLDDTTKQSQLSKRLQAESDRYYIC